MRFAESRKAQERENPVDKLCFREQSVSCVTFLPSGAVLWRWQVREMCIN